MAVSARAKPKQLKSLYINVGGTERTKENETHNKKRVDRRQEAADRLWRM